MDRIINQIFTLIKVLVEQVFASKKADGDVIRRRRLESAGGMLGENFEVFIAKSISFETRNTKSLKSEATAEEWDKRSRYN